MKILLVSWYFPPTDTIGAKRVGKFAEYMQAAGHEVRAVVPPDTGHPRTLLSTLDSDVFVETKYTDINAFPDRIKGWLTGQETPASDPGEQLSPSSPGQETVSGMLGRSYRYLTNFPDARVGWLPHAVRAGVETGKQWRPDIIFASGPPHSGLLAGYALHRRLGCPLVLEYRDRWVDDAYSPLGGVQRLLGNFLERRMIDAAATVITVSEPWADYYRHKFNTPVHTIMNGFDEDAYDNGEPCLGATGSGGLKIVYTGGIYVGKRDPSPLFEALQILGDAAAPITVDFYGTPAGLVTPLAEKYGIADTITIHPPVSGEQIIPVQQRADIVLLLQWNHPSEQGNVPGKLFEYLGARRPVLGIGIEDGVPAIILRQNNAGMFINDPPALARQLAAWLAEKREHGYIEAIPDDVQKLFTRNRQYRRLETILRKIVP